ncbi:hypothetical protein D3C80_984710 [compost metagenome]
MQLVEEAVEPVGQLAEFVLVGVVQAPGQVAFAAGDVLEHRRHTQDRSSDATGGQPDHHQAQHRGSQGHQQAAEVGAAVVRVQARVEFNGRSLQHLFRHFQQHAPRLRAGHRGERLADLQQAVIAELRCFAGTHLRGQGAGVLAEHLFEFLAQLRGIAAMPGQQAGGADDADLAVAVEQLLAPVQAQLLQVVEADVQAHHADDLAVLFEREGDAGHQRRAVADAVEVRIDYAGLAGFQRAGEPAVVG